MCILTLSVPQPGRLSKLERQLSVLCMSNLMLANAVSNRDGYGVISRTGSVRKAPLAGSTFFQTHNANEWLLKHIAEPLVGHVRTASTGLKAKDSAHPFVVGSLAVCHNGTISNYRALLKDVKDLVGDNSPVDSHVVAAMLAVEVGDAALSEKHLQTVLEKLHGSYSFLILDQKTKDIWVVAGGNPLYTQIQGPLLLVNTAKNTLGGVADYTAAAADIFEYQWEVGKPTKLDTFTAYRVDSEKLVKVCDLPKTTVVYTTVHSSYYAAGYPGTTGTYRGGFTTHPEDTSETVVADRAEQFLKITQIPGVSQLDTEMACFLLFQTRWTELSPEVLGVICATMGDIYTTYATDEKMLLWDDILAIEPSTPYSTLSDLLEFTFPWPLNTVANLEEARTLLGDKALLEAHTERMRGIDNDAPLP